MQSNLSSSHTSPSQTPSLPSSNYSTGKVILLTGGAGFIGSHVADQLLARGDKVLIVDEMNDYYDVKIKEYNLQYLFEKYGEDNLLFFKGNICDGEFMSFLFTNYKPNYVCHLAARAGVRASIEDPFIYVQSNVEGTTRLLELSAKHKVLNFVYASSSSVYGCSKNEVLRESDVVDHPVSPYAATKKACELLAYTYHHLYKLNVTGLRFFTVYGPRGRPDMAPFKFIDRVFRDKYIEQYGEGDSMRDYTYVGDIADGVVASIDKPLGCQVLNLGNGRPFKLLDFISLIEKAVGKKALKKILPPQPGDVDRTCADISLAKHLLGYSPKVTFEEGIEKTAQWYSQFYNIPIGGSSSTSSGHSDLLKSPKSFPTIDRNILKCHFISTEDSDGSEDQNEEVNESPAKRKRGNSFSFHPISNLDDSPATSTSNSPSTSISTSPYAV